MLDVNLLQIKKLYNKVQEKYASNQPFVIYKKPNKREVTGYFQNSKKLQILSSFTQSGFVFAPFKSEEKKVVFLTEECQITSSSVEEKAYTEPKELANFGDEELHKNKVAKAIAFIDKGNAQKIVISRKEVIAATNFNLVETFKRLLYFYPTAMVYCWYHPKVGLWLGATPEKLLTVKDNYLKTMALAATKPYVNTLKVVWNAKEKEEQQLVTNFILTILKKVSITINTEKTCTVKAGNLLHLCTRIKAKLQNNSNLEQLIKALHPTPAVAGLPKQVAIDFILNTEDYDREYYSGYLGELNVEKATHLYVNLRCMKYKDNNVAIYVGGGITKESNSGKEWRETVEKSKVIKKVLY